MGKFFSGRRAPGFDPRTPFITVYGFPGVGKTTFAIDLARCLDSELWAITTKMADSYMGKDSQHRSVPAPARVETWGDVQDALEEFRRCKAQALALDPVVEIERIAEDSLKKEHGVASLNAIGNKAGDGWRLLAERMNELIGSVRDMDRCLIGVCHEKRVTVEDALTGQNRTELLPRLYGSAGDVWLGASDCVWYMSLPHVSLSVSKQTQSSEGRSFHRLQRIRQTLAKYWQPDGEGGGDREIVKLLENLPPEARVCNIEPTPLFPVVKTRRSHGREFPPIIPLPGDWENTAQPVYETWVRLVTGGSTATKPKRRR